MHRAVPDVAILVIGPGDRFIRTKKRSWKPLAGIEPIIAAQRETCRLMGCAYWDQRERMGGPGSMRSWVYARWAQPDHTHFTGAGYQALAKALYADLILSYENSKRPLLRPE